MSISKFTLAGAVFAATLMTAMPMTAFAASDIKSASDCQFEGGSMVKVKGSDYCLVQIRPEEYAGTEYDGNQLGVVECPGSKLNDGMFCMYPVTLAQSATSVAPSVMPSVTPVVETAEEKTLADELVDIAKDEAEKKAKKETKKKARKVLGKLF